MVENDSPNERGRIGWWLFVAALAAIAGFIAYSFVGLIALGVFGYYAARPVDRQIERVIDSDGVAAWLTVLLIVVPVLLLVFYSGFRVVEQLQQVVGNPLNLPVLGEYLGALSRPERQTVLATLRNPDRAVQNPKQTIQTALRAGRRIFSAVFGTLVLLALALTLTYFLLENDDELADGFLQLSGGRDTAAYAYAVAVDDDLESVFFGNLLFVAAMSIIAGVAYWGTNVLAPPGVHVPMIPILAVLTGVTSLIPIVVGKVVYLPVVGYLAVQATRTSEAHLVFVAGALIVYALILDILPQTFLQPYLTGRQLDMVLMMFAYLLGPILFGWYGFFLLPILFVLMVEAVRIVLPELVHGEPLTRRVSMGDSVGADPESASDEIRDEDGPATDEPGPSDDA